ncbi:CRAL/TRIO domain-containing protein [Auriscalpium vulgare]|uniref:CRAL/TRIO domain-containing protein n=1 Tax=Auriscalpium vulgare TaxID=40419 RepID=A0ACB8RUI6_9AGAM|nr:CRAL/TRIO domain-containing protein [Auriscalpium vulgare]
MSTTATAAAPQPGAAPTPPAPVTSDAPTTDVPASPTPAPKAIAEEQPAAPEPTTQPTPTPTTTTKPGADVHDDEPQNTLTKKFTDAEWKALKEFRPLLPEILEKAYDEKPDAKSTPITIWGVTLDPSGAKDAKASVVLMKWLRARNLNVNEAKTMMIATLRWRDEFKVEEAMEEQFPEDVFGKLGHVYGKDKEGRPITYNLYGANPDLKAVFGDVQRFIRWRIVLMEKGIEKIDFETVDQMIQVHDYEGVGFNSRDANSKAAAAEATNIFQNHYPEFLSRKFFVNVPSFLTWIFWLFKPIMPAATFAKMKVVGHGPHSIGKELLPLVEADQLPQRYGGSVSDAW